MKIVLGKWTEDSLNKVLRESSGIAGVGQRIDFLSQLFLDVRYEEKTMIGNAKTPEEFVINLAGIDCFTLLDYVEAMRLSGGFSEFAEKVRRVRYRDGIVSFQHRNHFFTDWLLCNNDLVDDVSGDVGGRCASNIRKKLNMKKDGTLLLPGIQPVIRGITYIPSASLNESVLARIETGDYIGMYSDKQGLDVFHVGILIKEPAKAVLRHASLKRGKVVDEDFLEYNAGKPGIIVVRPKECTSDDS